MTEYAAPTGPPPPTVPEGWATRWNEQYQAWFYVNTYTKKSQWDKPTAPAEDPNAPAAPSGPPPSQVATEAEKEKPATAERAFTEQAPAVDLASRPGAAPHPRPILIVGTFQEKTKGAFPQQQQQQQQGYFNSPPPQQQGYYGGPPQEMQQQQQQQQQPQQYYGQPAQGGYYGAPAPQQQQYQQPVEKKKGMGTMGGAALGVGAGLLGGALIAGAISSGNEEEAYEEGMADAEYGGDDF
ncbi:hypothetical protein PG996_002851 [Apiospora saccharicola]|uniref:WW domain-containing protein n=1 Tax=Apiospora saccharicola TaxID=335842 RepID=A0ABR1WKJ8_9PEZI